MERAARAVVLYKQVNKGVVIDPRTRMDGMLEFYRRAAWPVGIDLDCVVDLHKLEDPEFFYMPLPVLPDPAPKQPEPQKKQKC